MNVSLTAAAPAAPRRYRFHVHVAVIFTAFSLLTGSLMMWHSHREISRLALSASLDVFRHIGRETVGEVRRLQAPIETLVDLLANEPLVHAAKPRAATGQPRLVARGAAAERANLGALRRLCRRGLLPDPAAARSGPA